MYSHSSLNKSYESNRSLMNSRATSRSNKSFSKSYKEKESTINRHASNNEQTNQRLRVRLHSAKLLNGQNNAKIQTNCRTNDASIGINSRNISKANN